MKSRTLSLSLFLSIFICFCVKISDSLHLRLLAPVYVVHDRAVTTQRYLIETTNSQRRRSVGEQVVPDSDESEGKSESTCEDETLNTEH